MSDKVYIVDRDCARCSQVKYPRRIKTQQSTFETFIDLRNNIIRVLSKSLKKDNKLVEYKDNRAIKIKERMNARVANKVYNLYSAMDKKKAEENAKMAKEEEIPEIMVSAAGKENEDIDVDVIDRQTVEDTINENLKTKDEEEPQLSKEDIESVINEKQDEIEEYASPSNKELTTEDLKDMINEKLSTLEEYSNNSENENNNKEDEFDNSEEKEEDPAFARISRNNTSNAKLSKYDNEGNIKEYNFEPVTVEEEKDINEQQEAVKRETIDVINPYDPYYVDKDKPRDKYQYVPMTDEEIREAQIKLGLEENNDNSTDEKVVGEANDVNEIEESNENLQEYSIEESDTNVEKVNMTSDNSTKPTYRTITTNSEDIQAIKEKYYQAKEVERQTKEESENTRKEARKINQKARQVKEKSAELDERIEAKKLKIKEKIELSEKRKKEKEEEIAKMLQNMEEDRKLIDEIQQKNDAKEQMESDLDAILNDNGEETEIQKTNKKE